MKKSTTVLTACDNNNSTGNNTNNDVSSIVDNNSTIKKNAFDTNDIIKGYENFKNWFYPNVFLTKIHIHINMNNFKKLSGFGHYDEQSDCEYDFKVNKDTGVADVFITQKVIYREFVTKNSRVNMNVFATIKFHVTYDMLRSAILSYDSLEVDKDTLAYLSIGILPTTTIDHYIDITNETLLEELRKTIK